MKRIRGDRVLWTEKMRSSLSKKRIGKRNPMYGKIGWWKNKKRPSMFGDKHHNWKGGYWFSKNGYKVIENEAQNEGKRIFEHRFIMEKYLGRKLESSEIIHHINGDKLDNRIDNLQIVDRKTHYFMHHPHKA